MDDNIEGGSAFPVRATVGMRDSAGMTLRDYFAAKAMQGELASQSQDNGYYSSDLHGLLVKKAYAIADAMLNERKT